MAVLDNVEKAIENSKRLTTTITSLSSLQEMANICKGCELHLGRTNVVFSKGNINSNIMVVGMAPAKQEDKKGIPFIGKSGKFLDEMFGDAGIKNNNIYITNIVKCYLKPGKVIKKKCVDACSYFLEKQIEIIKPKSIITLGKYATIAVYSLLDDGNYTNLKLATVQGSCREYNGIKVYSTYHPQYLARFGGKDSKYYKNAVELLKSV